MKKTQIIELLQLVRRSIVPFLSVALFVTMSITLYAGLTWTGRSVQDRIDSALDQENAYDVAVFSTLGLTDSDIESIGQLEDVSEVEPAWLSYQTIPRESEGVSQNLYCCVRSLPERISTVSVVEGTLPTKPGEIALLSNCTEFCDYAVGDTITFAADGDDPSVNDGMRYLTSGTFTITALVSSPDYLCDTMASLGINSEGKQITCVFYAPSGTFSTESFGNAYPVAYVTGRGLMELGSFSDEYMTASNSVVHSISQIGTTLAQDRYLSVKDDAADKIKNGQSQLDDAKAKIDDAEAQLADGKQQLTSKKAELADAQSQLDTRIADALSEMKEAQTQLDQAESTLTQVKDQYAQMQLEYDEGESQVDYYSRMSDSLKSLSDDLVSRLQTLKEEAIARQTDPDFAEWVKTTCETTNADTAAKVAAFKQEYPTRPSELEPLLDGLQLSSTDTRVDQKVAENAAGLGVAGDKIKTDVVQPGQEKLDEAKSALDQMGAGIAEAQEELDANRAAYDRQVAQAMERINYGKSQIAEGETQIADGETQLADGESQLAEKKGQYASGESKLDTAKESLQNLSESSWIITNREDSYVNQIVVTTSQTLSNLRLTMALLFMVVGLLVCYSVMSRLVHENLTQLGTKKALGFTLFEISKQFMGYALSACVIGILFGTLVGAPIVQLVLIPSINQYVFDPPGVVFHPGDVVVVALIHIVLICLSAWFACRSILEKNAVELLAGQRPSSAKRRFYERWSGWKRMGTLSQTMVNNCFNDKRRVFGTLVGVAGCTSLIVCAMTLQGGIRATTDEQLNVIETFDHVVYVQEGDSASAAGAGGDVTTVDDVIASNGWPSACALYAIRSIDLNDDTKAYATLIVPESMDDLSGSMTLQLTNGDSSPTDDGVYISSALANYYHYGVGDEIELDSSDGTNRKATISGIFNYYGGTHVCVMGKNAYESCFGEEPRLTARLVTAGEDDSAFASQMMAATDYDSVIDSREITREISKTVNNLALTVVAIYVGISALVALFVLLNLNIMYIAEKKRELVVMMVNGYELKDAKRYVSRDTIIMNAIGMFIGCLLGTGMGILATHSLQNNRLAFIAQPSPIAWLIGIVVCALFSFIVMHLALRRVNKFKLTSVND